MTNLSCSNTAKGAGIGAGGGAVLGGILGNIAGGGAKNTAIGAAIGAAVGAGAGAIIGNRMDKAKKQAQMAAQNAQVETVTDANGLAALKVTFDSGLMFATGKSDLNAASKNDLTNFADVLKQNADCDVAIFGHTDSTGSDAINNPLSLKRAQSVQSFLTSKGVAAKQFKTVEGKGSTQPVADNSTAEGKKQNRRVEVYLYASEAMINAANNGTLQQ
jgi:outer membrane protein OmpA-like peptidoglycan-associated protein